MFTTQSKVRVPYAETDQMGVVYHSHYFQYFEVARAEAIRELGFTYRQLEEQGIIMPVAELNVKYLRPAFYDDLITVKTSLRELRADHKIQFHSELFNEKGELLNVGVTTLVFLHTDTKQKSLLPQPLREKLEPFFNK